MQDTAEALRAGQEGTRQPVPRAGGLTRGGELLVSQHSLLWVSRDALSAPGSFSS